MAFQVFNPNICGLITVWNVSYLWHWRWWLWKVTTRQYGDTSIKM